MNYQIIDADKKIGQIQVAYKNTEGKIVGTYAIDVPVVDGQFITGDALHQEIVHRAPTWIVNREKEVAEANNFHHVEALIQKPEYASLTALQIENMEMWQKTQFEMQVAEVLVKYGLIDKNPTIIEVTKL